MAQPLIRLPIAGLILALLIPALAAGQDTIEFIDENGEATTEVIRADLARVRVGSAAANTQSNVAETVGVVLTTLYAGDLENLTLTETGEDTGVFEGAIWLAGARGYGAGFLEVSISVPPLFLHEQITADYLGLTAVAEVIDSRILLIDGWGREVSSYALGEWIYVRIHDQTHNFERLIVESLSETAVAPATARASR